MIRSVRSILLSAFAAAALGHPATAQNDSTWRDHARAAERERTVANWASYREHLLEIDRILGAYPGAVIGLARAAAQMGDTAAAFAQLRRFAEMGLARNLADDTDLASLRGTPSWLDLQRTLQANARPIGQPEV